MFIDMFIRYNSMILNKHGITVEYSYFVCFCVFYNCLAVTVFCRTETCWTLILVTGRYPSMKTGRWNDAIWNQTVIYNIDQKL